MRYITASDSSRLRFYKHLWKIRPDLPTPIMDTELGQELMDKLRSEFKHGPHNYDPGTPSDGHDSSGEARHCV